MRSLSFASDSEPAYLDWALAETAGFTGLRIRRARPGELPDLWYGVEARDCGLHIPRTPYDASTTWPDPSQAELRSTGRFPVDVFAALHYWLSDQAHTASPRDEHGRLPAAQSAQAADGRLERAVLNVYLVALRTAVELRTGVTADPLVPQGAKCVVALSHDVDDPFAHGAFRARLGSIAASVAVGRVQVAAGGLRAAAAAAVARARRPRDRFWLFDDVMREEERRGLRSTFFFAGRSRFDEGGTPRDVEYRLADREIGRIVRRLHHAGWEIGLHESYGCADRPVQIAEERRALEDVLGAPVDGGRHHYWHLGDPPWRTLRAHAAAGLRYDSSIAFNDAPGHRFSAAFPFRPWDPDASSEIPVVQVPVLAMDSQFFRSAASSSAHAVDRLSHLIEELKAVEGVAAVDWHDYTSFPASRALRPWGETYLALLDLLERDPEVAVMTCSGAAGLWRGALYDRAT